VRGPRGPVLRLGWHAWGFGVVVAALAAVASTPWIALGVLAAAAVVWLVGSVRALARRDGTLVARLVGVASLGFAVLLGLPGRLEARSWESWGLRSSVALGALLTLCAMLAVALVHASVLGLRKGRRWGALAQWLWAAVAFPLLVAGMFIALEPRSGAPFLVLVCAAVWLSGLVWAAQEKRLLPPRLVGALLAVGLLAAWPPVSLDAGRDAIAEAIFLHQLQRRDARGCFLSIDGHDPDAELLRRVAEAAPGVRRVSEAKPAPNRYVFGGRDVPEGAILKVDARSFGRSWRSPGLVTAEGGYYSGPLAAAGYTYWLAWRFGRWVVVEERTNWVS
jgi:hypothetical protein